MIRIFLLCICLGFLAACVQEPDATAQVDDTRITIGERFTIASETLGEDRPYWVHLPASYNGDTSASRHYPVMYLLDGDAHFQSVSGVLHHMSAGINGNLQVPEMIVVAIPNTNRTRDLTPTHSTLGFDGEEAAFLQESGGGDVFLDFVRNELFAKIDSEYRTTHHRVFVGHSFGGLMVLHAFLNVPGMFQSYLAIDPSLWWDNQLLLRQLEEMVAENDLSGSVFISLANTSNVETGEPSVMELAGREFGRILAGPEFPDVRSGWQYFESEDHGSVPLISLYRGLLSIFADYQYRISDFIANPSIESMLAHYKNVAEQIGGDAEPPENLVNQLGYLLLYNLDDIDKAIEMFQLNVTNYPASSNVYDSLGEAYMVNGDKALAIRNYEQSLALDPDNSNAEEQIESLASEE